MKTARFTTIVQSAGAPTVHHLWLAPGQDKALQKALKEQRVLTVHQDVRGTRKDFGTVGLVQEPEAQFLVFPKSLRRFAGQRVVGIDYQLLAQEAAPVESSPPPPRPAHRPRVAPTKPAEPASGRKSKSARVGTASSARPPAAPIIPFEEKSAAAPRPKATTPSTDAKAQPPSPSKKLVNASVPAVRQAEVLQQLRRVRAELKAGKAVAAYERLERLLHRLEK